MTKQQAFVRRWQN